MSLKPCRNPDCGVLIDTNTRRFYCSDACKQKHYRLKQSVVKPPSQKLVKHCRCCGQKFLTHYNRRQFCRPSCRVNYHQQQSRLMLREGLNQS